MRIMITTVVTATMMTTTDTLAAIATSVFDALGVGVGEAVLVKV